MRPLCSSKSLASGLALLTGMLTGTGVPEARAQPTVTIGDRVTCPACQVRITPVVTLGDPDGPGALGSVGHLSLLRDGRYAVTHEGASEAVAIFSAEGRFERNVGRKGSGPGEFRHALFTGPVGDGLMVADPLQRRISFFSKDLVFVRSLPLKQELLTAPVPLPDGRLLINALVPAREQSSGGVLHIVGPEGDVIRSLSERAAAGTPPMRGEGQFRAMALSPRGSVWVANRTRYRLEELSPSGDRLRSFDRAPAWFPPHAGGDNRLNPATPKKPRLLDVREDDQGRIWTISRVAATNWSKVLTRAQGAVAADDQPYVFTTTDAAYDAIVEVIDPRTGRLVASQRFDEALAQFVGPDRVVGYRTDENGFSRARIWQISLTGTP